MADLQELITKLTTTGLHKVESTSRRVRGLFNGVIIFDTTQPVFVWEHAYYPYFYIPMTAFAEGVLKSPSGEEKTAETAKVVVANKSTDRVIIFFSPVTGPLYGLVRVEFKSIDAWFVEDEQIYGHPKDPYSRVECIPSSRPVRIEIDSQVIAESASNIFLYETHLRPRYYLSSTSVKWEMLSPSETTTFCPYKGQANYYHVTVNGKEIKDAIWCYRYPTAESMSIAGRLCFYNEKFDVFIGGVKE